MSKVNRGYYFCVYSKWCFAVCDLVYYLGNSSINSCGFFFQKDQGRDETQCKKNFAQMCFSRYYKMWIWRAVFVWTQLFWRFNRRIHLFNNRGCPSGNSADHEKERQSENMVIRTAGACRHSLCAGFSGILSHFRCWFPRSEQRSAFVFGCFCSRRPLARSNGRRQL